MLLVEKLSPLHGFVTQYVFMSSKKVKISIQFASINRFFFKLYFIFGNFPLPRLVVCGCWVLNPSGIRFHKVISHICVFVCLWWQSYWFITASAFGSCVLFHNICENIAGKNNQRTQQSFHILWGCCSGIFAVDYTTKNPCFYLSFKNFTLCIGSTPISNFLFIFCLHTQNWIAAPGFSMNSSLIVTLLDFVCGTIKHRSCVNPKACG